MARNAEVDFFVGKENPDFCALRCGLSLIRFLLAEVRNWNCLLPDGIVKSAIHLRRLLDSNGLGDLYFRDCLIGVFRCLSQR